jgi:hypothetical protein
MATAYHLFVKEEMKKRPADVPPKEWMKEIGKRWQAQKENPPKAKAQVAVKEKGKAKKEKGMAKKAQVAVKKKEKAQVAVKEEGELEHIQLTKPPKYEPILPANVGAKSLSSWLMKGVTAVSKMVPGGIVAEYLVKTFGKRAVDFALDKRDPNKLPPKVLKKLKAIGKDGITSLQVFRTPLSGYVQTLLGVITLGRFKSAVEESPYDAMVHVGLLINDKYILEKNEEIVLRDRITKSVRGSAGVDFTSETTFIDVPIHNHLTIRGILETAKAKTNPEDFSYYNARRRNCQMFVRDVLKANKLWTKAVADFTLQDAELVFQQLPWWSEAIATGTTDLAAQVSKILQGGKLHPTHPDHHSAAAEYLRQLRAITEGHEESKGGDVANN